jgi:ERCC4-type nuclease
MCVRFPVTADNRVVEPNRCLLWTMAPTVTASAKSKTATARPKKGPKAKCAENQANLEILIEKKEKLRPSDKFGFTLKRAIESLQKSKEPVTTFKEALALAYVGPAIASVIFPNIPDKGDATAQPRKRKAKKTKDTAAASSSTSPNSSPTTKQAPEASSAPAAAKRIRHAAIMGAGEASTLVRSALAEKPTAKEIAYQNAISQAENYIGKKLTWRAILIVDGREWKSEHIQAKCQMSGIPCEERMLPIGDMAWIGQGVDPQSKNIVCELMLGTIIERKTTSDLKSSLFGTRYWEQRLRLQYSGIPQVLFLIEGDLSKELYNCPAETLHTAVMETRLHLGFQIVQTEHMDGTVAALKRMHRRVLQRSFPHAFGQANEALPTFAEAGIGGADRRESLPHQPNHRRRRKRLQSLMEMMFDTEPVPPLGESRFVTYKELKAKVERDREAGSKTIGSIHAAMLKQVATISGKKVQALARAYPTNASVMQAFSDEPNDDARKAMVADLLTKEPGQDTARVMKVGPRSAAELYVAYGMDCSEDESEGSDTDRRVSYTKKFEQVQAQRLSLSSQKGTASPAKQDLIFSSQEETKGVSRYASLSASALKETSVASSSVARAKPSIDDAAFWDDEDDDDDRSISEFLPTTNTNNKKTFSTYSDTSKAATSSWSPGSKQKAKSPAKQRLSMSSQEETSGTNLYASHLSSVPRETALASTSVARAKPSIHDAAFWDDEDDDDDLLPTAKGNDDNKSSSAYTNKATTSSSSPGSKENICVDLTDDTPARKISRISETLRALDSSDDEDSLFLERPSMKQKPVADQRLSFSSSSTTTTVVLTTATVAAATTKTSRNTQEVIEID